VLAYLKNYGLKTSTKKQKWENKEGEKLVFTFSVYFNLKTSSGCGVVHLISNRARIYKTLLNYKNLEIFEQKIFS